MPITHKTFKDANDAFNVCAALISISKYANLPFCQVYQDLVSAIGRGQYFVQVNDDVPVGFCTWIKLDKVHSEIYKNRVRWITPVEHDESGFIWVDKFCVGTSGDAKRMLIHLRSTEEPVFTGFRGDGRSYNLGSGEIENYAGIVY